MRTWNLLIDSVFGNECEKYVARHEILSSVAWRLGFRLCNRYLTWIEDEEYLNTWGKFPESYYRNVHDRKFVLYYLAKTIKDIPGDTAECGVYRGASSFLILEALKGKNDFKHHLFDSFEGLSEPRREDAVGKARTEKWNKGDLCVSETVVKENLRCFDNVLFHKGWIPERFCEAEDRRFAFVHIDVDLYQPTLDSLSFFYTKVNRGGIILCDDYGSEKCPGARKAMDEFFAGKSESVVHLPTGQGFIIKR